MPAGYARKLVVDAITDDMDPILFELYPLRQLDGIQMVKIRFIEFPQAR